MQTTNLFRFKYVLVAVLVAPALAFAADKTTKNLELKFGHDKAATQTGSIKQNEIQDVFFRAKKGQELMVKIASATGTAKFELSAMFELESTTFQKPTTNFTGKLPASGTGQYVIRVESEKPTTYTLTATLK